MTHSKLILEITQCRICGCAELAEVVTLGEQALTGVFPKNKDQVITRGPLTLVKCNAPDSCGLVQLKNSYDLSDMYGMNYGYRSGLNASMVKHLRSKVQGILDLGVLQENDLVIDIGSNDSTTLQAYPRNKYDLVGIDPTGVKFAEYYPAEIRLVADFFSAKTVREALDGKKAKVISSISMFYDLEDPVGFAREIEGALADEGVWVFEQSYLPAMLRTNSFDTICHEHLEFYALKQINWIADKAGLKVLDVEFNDINGGSFSITAAKKNASHQPKTEALAKILADETELGLDGLSVYEALNTAISTQRDALMSFLNDAKAQGKTVCGLGASTKGNVLLQHYQIDDSLLKCIGDVNADKFGVYTPGTLIPIESEKSVLAADPDYLMVLPWHFRSFFEQLPSMKGRKLVFPLPHFEIVQL